MEQTANELCSRSRTSVCTRCGWFCLDQRHFHQVLAQKPHLKLVCTQHFTDEKIISAVVAKFERPPGQLSSLTNNDLVPIEQGESWTETSSRPRGGRSTCVVSATSGAMAILTPPRSWIRSAIESTNSTCSSECLSKSRSSCRRSDPRPAGPARPRTFLP